MLDETSTLCAFVRTLVAHERLFTGVGSFVLDDIYELVAFVRTLVAHERLFTGVGVHVPLEL
jgi:hypothetical protein